MRRFDRLSRTVVMIPAGDGTSLIVEDSVPVQRFRPYRSRAYLRFSSD